MFGLCDVNGIEPFFRNYGFYEHIDAEDKFHSNFA